MAAKIQADLKVLNAKQKLKTLIREFKKYMNSYAELEVEYQQIPSWRVFKQLKNIRKRERLNRQFKIRMFELGIFI